MHGVTDAQANVRSRAASSTRWQQTEVGWLHERGVARRFERGAALFHERQLSDRVMVLLEGRVKIASSRFWTFCARLTVPPPRGTRS